MMRIIVTPTETNYNLVLPKDYVGQEVEIIAFRKDEVIELKQSKTVKTKLKKASK